MLCKENDICQYFYSAHKISWKDNFSLKDDLFLVEGNYLSTAGMLYKYNRCSYVKCIYMNTETT